MTPARQAAPTLPLSASAALAAGPGDRLTLVQQAAGRESTSSGADRIGGALLWPGLSPAAAAPWRTASGGGDDVYDPLRPHDSPAGTAAQRHLPPPPCLLPRAHLAQPWWPPPSVGAAHHPGRAVPQSGAGPLHPSPGTAAPQHPAHSVLPAMRHERTPAAAARAEPAHPPGPAPTLPAAAPGDQPPYGHAAAAEDARPRLAPEELKAAKDAAYELAKAAARTAGVELGREGRRALTHALYERVKGGRAPLGALLAAAGRCGGGGSGGDGGEGLAAAGDDHAGALLELAAREAARIAAEGGGD